MADPFGLMGGAKERREAMQRRVYASPREKLDKGNFVQQLFGTSDEAKEAKKRRGMINDDFRQQRRQAHEQWRQEDKKVREEDRRQREQLERYYNVHRYEKDTPQWQDAMKRVDEKFARYKLDTAKQKYERRNEQMRELQRQRDESVREMWKVLRSAGEGEPAHESLGERLL